MGSKVPMKETISKISSMKATLDKLDQFLTQPAIQNPTDPRDHFSTYMTAFIQTAKEKIEKLNASARQASKGYAELSKWLAFDEVKLPSEEFYKLLVNTKNELEQARTENKN